MKTEKVGKILEIALISGTPIPNWVLVKAPHAIQVLEIRRAFFSGECRQIK
ncbi:Uncharacterised protein [uncultured archaeon]|nr:Uncharacterised protein [uncultured archaeon]